MNEGLAARLLRENQVDTSWDTRPSGEVLADMVQKGYLPGSLLEQVVSIDGCPATPETSAEEGTE